jgi:hypothetical protein
LEKTPSGKAVPLEEMTRTLLFGQRVPRGVILQDGENPTLPIFYSGRKMRKQYYPVTEILKLSKSVREP